MKVIDVDDMEVVKFTEQRDDVIAYQTGWNDAIEAIIDNAPNVEGVDSETDNDKSE